MTIAVVDQQLGRHGPDAGRGGDAQAGGHVDRGPGGRAAQPGRHGRRSGRAGAGRRAGRRGGRRALWGSRRRCRSRRRGAGLGRGSGRGGCDAAGPAVPRWLAARAAVGAGAAGRAGRCRPAGCRGPALLLRGAGGPAPGGRGVVSEEIPPGHVHRAGVGQVTLVQLVHEPFVGPEVLARPAVAGMLVRCAPARSGGGTAELCFAEIRGLRCLRRHGGHRPLPMFECVSLHGLPGYRRGGAPDPGHIPHDRADMRSLSCGESQFT